MLWIIINSNILVLSYQPKKLIFYKRRVRGTSNFARGHTNKRETLQTGSKILRKNEVGKLPRSKN